MTATDRNITLSAFLKWNAPDGDVRICDGGFIDYASERYEARHAVFGSVVEWPTISAAMGDMAEQATLKLAPVPGADLADWWRTDLLGTRLRLWLGEVDTDLVTVSSAELLGDFLVDNVAREQGQDGSDLLLLDLTGRTERLFLTDEGNVCSDRFHQSVWSGETGFKNCTDVPARFAWGTADTTAEETSKGGKKKKKNK